MTRVDLVSHDRGIALFAALFSSSIPEFLNVLLFAYLNNEPESTQLKIFIFFNQLHFNDVVRYLKSRFGAFQDRSNSLNSPILIIFGGEKPGKNKLFCSCCYGNIKFLSFLFCTTNLGSTMKEVWFWYPTWWFWKNFLKNRTFSCKREAILGTPNPLACWNFAPPTLILHWNQQKENLEK